MLKVRRGEVPGVTSQLTTSVVDTYGQRNEIQTQANAVEEQLNALISKSYQAKEAAKAIGASFSDSFKNIINGTMTAQEALASFFQSIANHFLDMASQIIAKWIEMTILNTVLSLFPGGSALGNIGPGSGFAGGGSASSFGVMPGMSFFDVFSAKGNAFAQNGIVPFAMGGIVNSPTLFKFADGGAMRNGLMGEAGPEAIMPLTRGPGGRLGVDASGGGGDTISVVVNVDASGSKVSGSDTQANQLGRVVAAAVRSEIVQQKRPGGLLA
jgi:phage-related minor tail protein